MGKDLEVAIAGVRCLGGGGGGGWRAVFREAQTLPVCGWGGVGGGGGEGGSLKSGVLRFTSFTTLNPKPLTPKTLNP